MTFLTILLFAICFNRLCGLEMGHPFPFEKFLKVQKNDTSNTYPSYTCNTRANKDRKCSCDENCMQYGECCIDYMWTSAMSPQHPDKYLALFETRFDKTRSGLDCEKFRTILPDGTTSYKFHFMKSTCPGGTARELEKKCTDNDEELPVLSIGKTFLYKNMFCAQCNLESRVVKIDYIIMCQGKTWVIGKQTFTLFNRVQSIFTSLRDTFSSCWNLYRSFFNFIFYH